MTNLTCTSCGWVMFGVTRDFAEKAVADFNAYFETLNPSGKAMYGKGASIESYEQCFNCGGSHENFREAKDGDCPEGCTMQPIIEGGEG
jgi:hypothetical protein